MRRALLRIVATVAVVGCAWSAQAQPSEPDIAAVIQRGLADKNGMTAVSLGGLRYLGVPFIVLVSGPLNRIQDEASRASKQYKPFTRADVTPAMLEDLILVMVRPKTPESRDDVSLRAEHVVLRTRTKPTVTIQPTGATLVPVSWVNGFGATTAGQGLDASFSGADLPSSEFEIVIVTQASRDTRLLVTASQLAKIR